MFGAFADKGRTTIRTMLLDAGNARLVFFSVSAFRTNTITFGTKSLAARVRALLSAAHFSLL